MKHGHQQQPKDRESLVVDHAECCRLTRDLMSFHPYLDVLSMKFKRESFGCGRPKQTPKNHPHGVTMPVM